MSEAGKPTIKAAIVGVSGYSGMELARILANHPRIALALVTTDKWQGKRLGDRLPLAGPAAALPCVAHAEGQAQFAGLDVVFLCTPAEASITLAPVALAAGARVVDLSGAFRLEQDQYPTWYGFEHGNAQLLADAVYSMPEVTDTAAKLRTAKLVSNPGCYPTPSVFAVLPLLRAGLIEADPIFIDAKSGTTGGGRKAAEDWSFSEVADDIKAYRILKHQHQPEIERALALGGAPGACGGASWPRRTVGCAPASLTRPPPCRRRWPNSRPRNPSSGSGRPKRCGCRRWWGPIASSWVRPSRRRAAWSSLWPPSTTWSRARPARQCRTRTSCSASPKPPVS
jgi:hypothetical protein